MRDENVCVKHDAILYFTEGKGTFGARGILRGVGQQIGTARGAAAQVAEKQPAAAKKR